MVQKGDRFLIKNGMSFGEVTDAGPHRHGFEVSITGYGRASFPDRATLEQWPDFDGWAVLGGVNVNPHPVGGIAPPALSARTVRVGDTFNWTGKFSGPSGTVVSMDSSTGRLDVQLASGGTVTFPGVTSLELHPCFNGWRVPQVPTKAPYQPQVGDRVSWSSPNISGGQVISVGPGTMLDIAFDDGSLGCYPSPAAVERDPAFCGWIPAGMPHPSAALRAFVQSPVPAMAHMGTLQYWESSKSKMKVGVDYAAGLCQDCGETPEDRHFSTFSFKFCSKCRKEVP